MGCVSAKKKPNSNFGHLDSQLIDEISKAFQKAQVSGSFDYPIDNPKVAFHIFSGKQSENYITSKEKAEEIVKKMNLSPKDYGTLATSLICEIDKTNPEEIYLKSGFKTKLLVKKLLEDQELTFDSSDIAISSAKILLFKNSKSLRQEIKEVLIISELNSLEKKLNDGFMEYYGVVINAFYNNLTQNAITKISDIESPKIGHHDLEGYSMKFKSIENVA